MLSYNLGAHTYYSKDGMHGPGAFVSPLTLGFAKLPTRYYNS